MILPPRSLILSIGLLDDLFVALFNNFQYDLQLFYFIEHVHVVISFGKSYFVCYFISQRTVFRKELRVLRSLIFQECFVSKVHQMANLWGNPWQGVLSYFNLSVRRMSFANAVEKMTPRPVNIVRVIKHGTYRPRCFFNILLKIFRVELTVGTCVDDLWSIKVVLLWLLTKRTLTCDRKFLTPNILFL